MSSTECVWIYNLSFQDKLDKTKFNLIHVLYILIIESRVLLKIKYSICYSGDVNSET